MKRKPEVLYRAALDRLLTDVGEFMARYAWTDQHDESLELYERVQKARELLKQWDLTAQGAVR